MADSTKSAVEVLEEMKAERNELDRLIQGLEKRLGVASVPQVSGRDEEDETHRVFPPVTSMPIGFFHNLSQAAAAEKLLRMNPDQPYTTGQILEAFRNSGMTLNPKNSVQIIYTALKRNPKFERVGNKAWGLREWYPERKKRVSKEESSQDDKASG
jgi:hypothetical protein